MAVVVPSFQPRGIPGLDQPLSAVDMTTACATYNNLPYIESQLTVGETCAGAIQKLREIIDLHGLGQVFRIHSAHRHDLIPEGTVRVESGMDVPGCKWTHALPISTDLLDSVHATLFKVTAENGLVAFEFAKGPSPLNGTQVPDDFIHQAAAYIATHGLADKLVLEVASSAEGHGTAELEVEWNDVASFTVALPRSMTNEAALALYPSSWGVSDTAAGPEDGGMVSLSSTVYAEVKRPKDTHKVFINKPTLAAEGSAVIGALKERGIVSD